MDGLGRLGPGWAGRWAAAALNLPFKPQQKQGPGADPAQLRQKMAPWPRNKHNHDFIRPGGGSLWRVTAWSACSSLREQISLRVQQQAHFLGGFILSVPGLGAVEGGYARRLSALVDI